MVHFTFKHPVTDEIKVVTFNEDYIRDLLRDQAHEELTCECEPVGETNVVDCNCEDYLEEFEMIEG